MGRVAEIQVPPRAEKIELSISQEGGDRCLRDWSLSGKVARIEILIMPRE